MLTLEEWFDIASGNDRYVDYNAARCTGIHCSKCPFSPKGTEESTCGGPESVARDMTIHPRTWREQAELNYRTLKIQLKMDLI